jgi:hypothetical protein
LLIEKLKRISNYFRTPKSIKKENSIEEEEVIGKRIWKDLARFTQRIATEYITTRDMDNFINCIKGKKIDVVIDIRWSTYHKTKQGFGPVEFKKHLESNGINYFYIKALGNPFHALYDQKEPSMCHRFWLKEALINYKRNKLDIPGEYILVKKINKSLLEISEMIA